MYSLNEYLSTLRWASGEARVRAAEFERRYPSSLFVPTIARALRSIP